jgi:hypothetical protein
VAVLGVTRGLRAPGPQLLEVAHLQPVSREEQLQVQREAGVAAGQDEPVATLPSRVGGVVAHHALEQQVGRRREGHGRPRMSAAAALDGVRRQDPGGVDGAGVELRPVVGNRRGGQRGDLVRIFALGMVRRCISHGHPLSCALGYSRVLVRPGGMASARGRPMPDPIKSSETDKDRDHTQQPVRPLSHHRRAEFQYTTSETPPPDPSAG